MSFIQKPITFQALSSGQLELLDKEISQLQFSRSGVVGDGTSNARTSESSALPYKTDVTKYLKKLAAETFHVPERQCEPSIHVARYISNQEYRPHHDSCCDSTQACTEFKNNWGDRIGTLLIYMNDNFTGGHTEFPHLNLQVKPRAGMAVAWRSSDCPDWALHAGKPVIAGMKVILTVWVRERNTH